MQFTKHIHVLHLLSEIPTRELTHSEAVASWDHLFHYIHNHWAKPLTSEKNFGLEGNQEILDCRSMLNMSSNELVAKLSTLPPYFTESIFPIAVARFLLRDMRLPLRSRDTTTFKEFCSRYSTAVLSA